MKLSHPASIAFRDLAEPVSVRVLTPITSQINWMANNTHTDADSGQLIRLRPAP